MHLNSMPICRILQRVWHGWHRKIVHSVASRTQLRILLMPLAMQALVIREIATGMSVVGDSSAMGNRVPMATAPRVMLARRMLGEAGISVVLQDANRLAVIPVGLQDANRAAAASVELQDVNRVPGASVGLQDVNRVPAASVGLQDVNRVPGASVTLRSAMRAPSDMVALPSVMWEARGTGVLPSAIRVPGGLVMRRGVAAILEGLGTAVLQTVRQGQHTKAPLKALRVRRDTKAPLKALLARRDTRVPLKALLARRDIRVPPRGSLVPGRSACRLARQRVGCESRRRGVIRVAGPRFV